jgi:hypothetical protein
MGIDRDNDNVLDADDPFTCSASPVGRAHRENVLVFLALIVVGVTVGRRRCGL